MVLQKQPATAEDFDHWVMLPENSGKLFEFIGGEIIEVVSNLYSSEIAALIIFFIQAYLRENNIAGHVTGADGGYRVGKERYIPDVAFISFARQPELAYDEIYNPNPPDLAVEVISPRNTLREITLKVSHYLAVGTVVWIVYPLEREVHIHISGQPARIVDENGIVDGGETLPDFQLAVKDIFPRKDST